MEGEKVEDNIDIEDIEAFIDGLKNSFDTLESADLMESQALHIQARLAKTISKLRLKKIAKIEPLPEFIGHLTPLKLKKILLDKLEELNNILEKGDYIPSKKFDLVMKIAKLRARISSDKLFKENKKPI